MKAIADTGFFVAFANKRDTHHAWAAGLAEQVSEPLLTCEPVLAEAAFHLSNTLLALNLIHDGLARIAFDCHSHEDRLRKLAARYADRNPDLADLCLIRMSELFPQHRVITVDENDFRIYRRNKRERIPLICPF